MEKDKYCEYYKSEIQRMKEIIDFKINEIESAKTKIKESEQIIESSKEDIQTIKEIRSDLISLYNSKNK